MVIVPSPQSRGPAPAPLQLALGLLLVASVAAVPAGAQIFKCTAGSGQVLYQNEPCPKNFKADKVEIFDNSWTADRAEKEAHWQRQAAQHHVVAGMPLRWVRETLGEPAEISSTATAGAKEVWLYNFPDRNVQVGILADQVLWSRETPVIAPLTRAVPEPDRGAASPAVPDGSGAASAAATATATAIATATAAPDLSRAPSGAAVDAPRAAPDASRAVTAAPRPAPDAAWPAPEAPRAAADAPRATADAPRATADAPRATADAPRATTDAPRATADAPRATADAPRAAPDAARAAAELSARSAQVSPRVSASTHGVVRGQDCKQALAALGKPDRQRDVPALDSASDPVTEYFYEPAGSENPTRMRIVCANGKVEGVDHAVLR